MRSLSKEEVWTYTDKQPDGGWDRCKLRQSHGIEVSDYIDLATKVAAIQFHNPNFYFLFRGQQIDHRLRENQNSTIRPSIFRRDEEHNVLHWNALVASRYRKLKQAEKYLSDAWTETVGKRKLNRSSVIKWAILQHYEVCDTPLLDVTHSLRIAASFASLNNSTEEAYLMVLALPQISGSVSSCAYHELQILRLSSLCPPSAIRPHIQEGYLIGEYPELRTYDEKMDMPLYETDFGQRLIGKLKFNPKTFWNASSFPMMDESALYPNTNDSLYEICASIKAELDEHNT